MITEPISFTGRLSLEDVLNIHRYHSRIIIRRSIRVLMAVVSVVIATVIIIAGLYSHFVPFSFFLLALCAYFPFGWFFLDRISVRRRYHRNQDKFLETTVTFTNESVSTTCTIADARFAWDLLAFVVATPRGLLFLVPPHNTWFWLPERVFEGNNHRETILKLATEHKIPIRRMA